MARVKAEQEKKELEAQEIVLIDIKWLLDEVRQYPN